MSDKLLEQTRLARLAANEWATGGIKFAGESPFAGIPADKADAMKRALVFYAEAGAQAAIHTLRLHGHLKP